MIPVVWIAIGVGLVAGVLIGRRVAQRSIKEEVIYGGVAARRLHLLACMAFTGGVPAGLVDIIFGRNLLAGVLLALCFIGVSFAALLAFAVVENGPRQAALAADRGWTAEKAKSSGL